MTHSTKALTLGMTVFLTAALTGLVQGQVPGTTRADVTASAAVALDANQHTQQLIAHALGMAINGSDLQLIARAARQGQIQRQDQDRNRDANDRDDDNLQNENRGNAGERNRGDWQTAQILERQAWQQFEGSNQLLRTAYQDLMAQENAANAPNNDRVAWSRRLYNAANQYVTTLRNVSGVSLRQPGAYGSIGGERQNDQDRNRGDDQDRDTARNQDRNRNTGPWSRTDALRTALTNQAVKEAIEAFKLNNQNQLGSANRAVPINTPAQQQLQEHARRMAAESNQVLERVRGTLNQQDDQNLQNNANRQDNQDQQSNRRGIDNNANEPQGQNQNQDRASVTLLVQQAQQMIETLQRIDPVLGTPSR